MDRVNSQQNLCNATGSLSARSGWSLLSVRKPLDSEIHGYTKAEQSARCSANCSHADFVLNLEISTNGLKDAAIGIDIRVRGQSSVFIRTLNDQEFSNWRIRSTIFSQMETGVRRVS
jgi:hypothetical protein